MPSPKLAPLILNDQERSALDALARRRKTRSYVVRGGTGGKSQNAPVPLCV
jgi:hypothetical protein